MRKINNIRCLWNYQNSQKVITDSRTSSFLSHAVYTNCLIGKNSRLKETMQVTCKMNFDQSFMYRPSNGASLDLHLKLISGPTNEKS